MVIMEMRDHRIIDLAVSRKILHEMTHVDRLPFAGSSGRIRMLLVLYLTVISGIDHEGRAVRHDEKGRISPTGGDGMNIQISFLPFREVFLRCGHMKAEKSS